MLPTELTERIFEYALAAEEIPDDPNVRETSITRTAHPPEVPGKDCRRSDQPFGEESMRIKEKYRCRHMRMLHYHSEEDFFDSSDDLEDGFGEDYGEDFDEDDLHDYLGYSAPKISHRINIEHSTACVISPQCQGQYIRRSLDLRLEEVWEHLVPIVLTISMVRS
jgi:hypothetical protein